MDAAQYVQHTRQRLLADGNEVSDVVLRGGAVLIGYQSQFKMRWMATKLHLFTGVAAVPQATAQAVAALSAEAIGYAKATKGQLRGLQTGVAAIPALVADEVTPDGRAAAEARPAKEFAAIVLPAVVDLRAGQVYSYTGTIVIGAVYAGFLRERVRTIFPAPPPNP
ncbi:MAG: levansucrase [Acidimicrobiales bacterium]